MNNDGAWAWSLSAVVIVGFICVTFLMAKGCDHDQERILKGLPSQVMKGEPAK